MLSSMLIDGLIQPLIGEDVPIPPPVINRTFIYLDMINNGFYSLTAQWVSAASTDCAIEFDVMTTETGVLGVIDGGAANVDIEINAGVVTGTFAGTAITSVGLVNDGKLNSVRIERVSSTYNLYINGVLDNTGAVGTGLVDVDSFGNSAANFFNGILADVILESATPSNTFTFLINQAGSSENALEGGNSINYNNIFASDRYNYTMVGGDWLSDELILDGDFSSGTNWITGAGNTITGGQAVWDGTQVTSDMQQSNVYNENMYKVTMDIDVTITAGQPQLYDSAAFVNLSAGTNNLIVNRLTGSFTSFYIRGGSSYTGTMDNASSVHIMELG